MPENLLFVPSVKSGNGTGHLKRVIKICQEMRNISQTRAFLFIDGKSGNNTSWTDEFPELSELDIVYPETLKNEKYNLIILDQRETSWSDFHAWESLGRVILLDEGGESRGYGSYLIDTLPGIHRHKPNYSDISFLGLHRALKQINWSDPSILISFGGEDPENLTLPAVNVLLNRLGINPGKIGVVQGPRMGNIQVPSGVNLHRNMTDLIPLFEKSDIFIGAFGITPLEAASMGCAVILVNPSPYHEKLSVKAGIISSGIKRRGIKKLPGTYLGLIREKRGPSTHGHLNDLSLAHFIQHLKEGGKSSCPLCLAEKNPVVDRFQFRTYFLCGSCHNYYMVNWKQEEELYDREYFFSRYKDQYGKTYLEDFQYIKDLGKVRLEEIEKVLCSTGRGKNSLLTDLGCAFGPFLAAAAEKGYSCRGVEINRDGADWVEAHLGIPVVHGSLADPAVKSILQKEKSRIITLWYVIEHIPDQNSFLHDLHSYLEPGGLLALGTPSGKGISERKSRHSFLKSSPGDHYVIYTPKGIRRILSRAGFSVKKIKSVGHHPERFGKWVGKKGSITYNVVMFISQLFFLGDSLEVYAVKADNKELR